jgi:TolA-binding protein
MSKLVCTSFLILCSAFSAFPGKTFAWQKTGSQEDVRHDFRTHVEHFLNRRFRTHFLDMSEREKFLLQLVTQLKEELEERRREGNVPRILPGEKVEPLPAELFGQYDEEIDEMVRMFGEADSLSFNSDQEKVAGELMELNRDILEALELETDIYLYDIKPQRLYTDYISETEAMLELYQRLLRIESLPASDSLKDEISFQKAEIRNLLVLNRDEELEALSDEFVEEMNLLDGLIARIDALQEKALQKDADVAIELSGLRNSLVSSLDQRIVNMLDKPLYKGPGLLHVFREWQARDVAQFERSLAQHQIMRKELISNGSQSQIERMHHREMTAALSNFAKQDFALSASQFEAILTAYPESVFNADARFYLAESYYQHGRYRKAAGAFENVVVLDKGSEYESEALFRLVSLSRLQGKPLQAINYSKLLLAQDLKVRSEIHDRAFYLAGIVLLEAGLNDDAINSFARVTARSGLREMSLFLSGTARVAKGDFELAASVFEEVVSYSHWTSKDPLLGFPSNASMWKLALLDYEAGDYDAALSWIERIDTGFENLDDCLIAAAWGNLNLGNPEETLKQLNAFLKSGWDSESLYEARVLAAYCKQNLDLKDRAADDFEYVYHALRIDNLTVRYFDERDFVLRQLDRIDLLAEEALDQLDKNSHELVETLRDQEQERLAGFRYTGAPDNSVIRRFDEEREQMIDQMAELDEIIADATKLGLADAAEDARYQQQRLAESLLKWQPDGAVRDVTFFTTHPVAAKAGLLQRRAEKHEQLTSELAIERRILSELQGESRALVLSVTDNDEVKSDISRLETVLSATLDDLDNLDSWVAKNRPKKVIDVADVRQWANLASAEMTEIAFRKLKETDEELSQLAIHTRKVNELLADRETSLQERVRLYQDQLRQLEKALYEEQLLEKERQRTLFYNENFFDTDEREAEVDRQAGEEAK